MKELIAIVEEEIEKRKADLVYFESKVEKMLEQRNEKSESLNALCREFFILQNMNHELESKLST